jgi:protein disulfide-isomerase A1
MAPAYKELGQQFNIEGSKIKIAKLDATVHKNFAEKHGIEGFPTIKLFVNGKPIDYSGERNKDAMTAFIHKKTSQGTKIIKTAEELNEFRNKKISALVVLPSENTQDMKSALELTNLFDDLEVAVLLDRKLLDKKLDSEKSLILFRKFDDGDKVLNLEKDFNVEIVKQFINGHKFPIVAEFDQEAANRIFGEKLETMFFFDENFESENAKIFKDFAKSHHAKNQKIVFSISKIAEGFGQRLSEYLGVTHGPSAVIVKFSGEGLDKFKVTDISYKGLEQGLDDFIKEKVKPYYKSAKIPEHNDEPVKVVVGDSFQSIVMESGKFVLLEAYAPWCGHCKSLEPIYKELAEKLLPFKH